MSLLFSIVSTARHESAILRRPLADDFLAAVRRLICSVLRFVFRLQPLLDRGGRHVADDG